MPRVNFHVDVSVHKRLGKIPFGYRTGVFRKFLERFVVAYEREGMPLLGVMLEGSYDIVPRYPSGDKDNIRSKRTAR